MSGDTEIRSYGFTDLRNLSRLTYSLLYLLLLYLQWIYEFKDLRINGVSCKAAELRMSGNTDLRSYSFFPPWRRVLTLFVIVINILFILLQSLSREPACWSERYPLSRRRLSQFSDSRASLSEMDALLKPTVGTMDLRSDGCPEAFQWVSELRMSGNTEIRRYGFTNSRVRCSVDPWLSFQSLSYFCCNCDEYLVDSRTIVNQWFRRPWFQISVVRKQV